MVNHLPGGDARSGSSPGPAALPIITNSCDFGNSLAGQRSHDTARKDLLGLVAEGLLVQRKSGRKMVFYPSPSLEQSIRDGEA